MKCPSCGAETNSAKYCEYCGSELPKNNSSINITNNYYGNATAPTEHSSTGGKSYSVVLLSGVLEPTLSPESEQRITLCLNAIQNVTARKINVHTVQ